MPSLAAPLVLSVCGGVALVLAFGTLFGLQPRGLPTMMAGPDIEVAEAAAKAPEPEPALASAVEPESPAEEPALVTALPDAPTTDTGEAIFEPIAPQPQAAIADAASDSDPDPATAIQPALPAQITAFAPQPRPAGPDERPARSDDRDAPAARARDGAPSRRAAVVRQAVNLRATPDKGGRVLMVVPASARIEAQANCGWCEISYQGRTGFIYRSFIDYR